MNTLLMTAAQAAGLNPLPKDTSAQAMVQAWEQRIAGTNLARGRNVAFDNPPCYHLTMVGGNDAHDLTDGKLASSSGTHQRIWFDQDAVGWTADYPDSRFVVDLGEVKAVDRIVWRVSGGNPPRDFRFPSLIRVYASPDGNDVREVTRLRFDPAGGDGTYHLPDQEEVYIYPLTIPLHGIPARYVCVRFQLQSAWFVSDEVAVIQGTGTNGARWETLPRAEMQMTGISMVPEQREMTIVPGFQIPIYFNQFDLRTDRSRPVTYHLQASPGLEITPVNTGFNLNKESATALTGTGAGGYRRLGPVYLRMNQARPVTLTVWAEDAPGERQPPLKLTLRPQRVPAFEPFKRLHFSIGWMSDHIWHAWPDVEKTWRRLGFNNAPTMPRGWLNEKLLQILSSAKGIPTGTPVEQFVDKLRAMRDGGFQVVYVESPFHVVTWLYPEEDEYRCQLPTDKGKAAKESMCASYRGRFYQDEIRRIADHFATVGGAEYVFLDIEMMVHVLGYSQHCPRCQQAKAALETKLGRKLSTEEFACIQCEAMLTDVVQALRETATRHGWKAPQVGLYATEPPQVAIHTFRFDRLYPEVLQYAMPSFYVQGNHQQIHDVTRRARATLRGNDIIPWLTAGTAGHYEPYKLRLGVWEALLNGSRGVTFFCDIDFYPTMLTEFARAVQPLRSYETLLCDGEPVHPTTNPESWRVSMIRYRKQTLLLAVNTGNATADSRALRSMVPGGRWTLVSNPAASSNWKKTLVPPGEGCLWSHRE